MEYSRLYFWKDMKACTKHFMERYEKSEEDVEHQVKLAMIFGSVVSFKKESDRKAFEASGAVKV